MAKANFKRLSKTGVRRCGVRTETIAGQSRTQFGIPHPQSGEIAPQGSRPGPDRQVGEAADPRRVRLAATGHGGDGRDVIGEQPAERPRPEPPEADPCGGWGWGRTHPRHWPWASREAWSRRPWVANRIILANLTHRRKRHRPKEEIGMILGAGGGTGREADPLSIPLAHRAAGITLPCGKKMEATLKFPRVGENVNPTNNFSLT